VVIITHGRIMFDGSLSQIIDRFGGHKVVTLLFADGHIPGDLGVYGEVLSAEPPRAKVRIERADVAKTLSRILQQHPVEDVSVEDPPLEQVIAEIFSQVNDAVERDDAKLLAGSGG
jgi:ABC-2 type transport system ATP-binding protein